MKHEDKNSIIDNFEQYLVCLEAYKSGDRNYKIINCIGKTLYSWARYREALKFFKIGLWYYKNYFYFLYYKSEILNSRKMFKKAVKSYEKAIKYYDDSGDKWFLILKENLANNYFNIGKIDKAKILSEDILTKYPDNFVANNIIKEINGEVNFGINNFDYKADYRFSAWIDYEAKTFGNQEAKLYLRVIKCLNGANLKLLEEDKNIYPSDFYFRVLGATFYERENYKLAEEYFRKAVAENRTVSNLSLLADCLDMSDEQDNGKEAEHLYREVLELEPDNNYVLGRVSRVTDDCDFALQCVEKNLKCNPKDFISLYWLSELYFNKGMYKESLEKALEARCKCWQYNPSIISMLIAKCYNKLGSLELANAEVKRAVIEDPCNESVKILLDEENLKS